MLSGKQKKAKRTKVKKEKPPRSPPVVVPVLAADDESEKDLTHYIRDRVELMRQIFSILKDRELVAMAPQCLRVVKVDDLQELCLDEVLGISSTRLASILDGCSCPSDTDSSDASLDTAPQLLALETISLDSISSDEGQPLLAQVPAKAKKKKHHRHHQEADKDQPGAAGLRGERGSRGGRGERGPAGMTVLELLELQARARAIRAQLQAVHANIGSDPEEGDGVSAKGKREGGSADEDEDEDEVVIKEEPPEVVEVVSSSSDEEQPSDKKMSSGSAKKSFTSVVSSKDKPKNDHVKEAPTLVVSMPVLATPNHPRKIKLKRNNLLVSVANVASGSGKAAQEGLNINTKIPVTDLDKAEEVEALRDTSKGEEKDNATKRGNEKRKDDLEFVDGAKSSKPKGDKEGTVPFNGRMDGKSVKDRLGKVRKPKNKGTSKARKKKSKTSIDEDEIMLELSDTEKNDLLDSCDSKSSSEESSDEEAEVDLGKDSVDKLTTKDDEVTKTDRNSEVVKASGDGESTNVTDEATDPDNEVEVASIDKAVIDSQNKGVVLASSSNVVIDLDSGGEVDKNAVEREEITVPDVVNDSKGVEVMVTEDVDVGRDTDNAIEISQHAEKEVEETETAKDKNSNSKKKKKKSKKTSRESRRSNEPTDGEKTRKNLDEDPENVGKKKRQNSVKDLENLQPNTAAKEVLIGDSLNIGKGLESIEHNESIVSVEIPEEELSEGECSYSSDGIEITELEHEVVCISDDAISIDSVEEGRPKKKNYRKQRKSDQDHDSSSSEDCGKRKDPSFEASVIEYSNNSNNTDEELGKYDDVKKVDMVCVVQDDICKEKDEVSVDGCNDSGNGKTDLSQTNITKELGDNKISTIEIKTEKVALEKDMINPDSTADAMKGDDYEVFEISDDTSDEEATYISKEPTTEEIVELSKKIDSEIHREDIVFQRRITGEIVDVEMRQEILKSVGVSDKELSDSSWKERWLKSDKVRKVLATSNLCNALRKKNKEIKLKLIEDAKAEEVLKQKEDEESKLKEIEKLKTKVDLNDEDNTDQRLLMASDNITKAGIHFQIDTETKASHKGIESDVKIDEGCTEGVESGVETKESCIKVKSGNETKERERCIDGVRIGVQPKDCTFEDGIALEGTKIDIEPSKLMPIEGSVDLYMTLASSTKYVDPVIDQIEENRKKAMAKDARQLMKMYKKLVKIHNKVAGEKKKKKDKKEKKNTSDLSNIIKTSQL